MNAVKIKDAKPPLPDIPGGKEYMDRQIRTGNLREYAVAACTYQGPTLGGAIVNRTGEGQICHAHVPQMRARFHGDVVAMFDHIQHHDDDNRFEQPCVEAYLQWWMDSPLFGRGFLEKDAKTALKERIMVRDISTLPANVEMLAIIAGRALWESFQARMPKNYFDMVESGVDKDLAMLLSSVIKKDGKVFTNTRSRASGHDAFKLQLWTLKDAARWMRGEPSIVAPETLAQGCRYYNSGYLGDDDNLYNVFSTFLSKFADDYGAKGPGEDKDSLMGWLNGAVTKGKTTITKTKLNSLAKELKCEKYM